MSNTLDSNYDEVYQSQKSQIIDFLTSKGYKRESVEAFLSYLHDNYEPLPLTLEQAENDYNYAIDYF